MNGGESEFKRIVYGVIQDVKKQMLFKGSNLFEYVFDESVMQSSNITSGDTNNALNYLERYGAIKIGVKVEDRGPGGRVNPHLLNSPLLTMNVKVNTHLLNKAEAQTKQKEQPSHSKQFNCEIYIHDTVLTLRVDKEAHPIANLHEGSKLHKLLSTLNTRRGRECGPMVVEYDWEASTNLWQIISNSHYGYLSPFFERTAKNRILLRPQVDLDQKELSYIFTKIIENYRKKFVVTTELLNIRT